MTASRTIKFLVVGLLSLVLICLLGAGIVYALAGDYLASFPEAFFGQMTLARETRPLMPREALSAEFVLGQVDLGQVQRAEYIALGEEVSFWDPQYAGFPRTALSTREVQSLQDLLSGGQLFQPPPTGDDYRCVTHPRFGGPRLESCPEGAALMDRYAELQGWSEFRQTAGALVLYLSSGQVVEIRLYPSERGLAYEPQEAAGPWWLKGVSASSELVETIAGRVKVEPVPLLWPRMTAEQANARARRVLGLSYGRALDAVRQSAHVRAAFGEPLVLRPAVATNVYASWMDSTSVTLTLAVNGPKGEGAVMVRGYEVFEIEGVKDGQRWEERK